MILSFDPGGDGLVSVALGDPSIAKNVAVTVPGIGSELHNFTSMLDDASRIRGSDGQTSVIAWLGYDAPAGVTDWSRFPDQLSGAGEQRAAVGAIQLQQFLEGMSFGEGQRVTVLGHSYGSVVTLRAAAAGGLPMATNIVTLGSPGSELHNSVHDLQLAEGQQFYSLAADRDHVSGSFGDIVPGHASGGSFPGSLLGAPGLVLDSLMTTRVPSDPGFGGTRLETDAWGDAHKDSVEHSNYYEAGSGGLKNVQGVVTGGETQPRSVQFDDLMGFERGLKGELNEWMDRGRGFLLGR
jgi:pimeloyl-ACP methyl ester carboxylesterase